MKGKQYKRMIHKDTEDAKTSRMQTKIFAAFFVGPPNCKLGKCLLIGKLVNKLWSIHTESGSIINNKLEHLSRQFSVPFCTCFHSVAYFSRETWKYKSRFSESTFFI